MSQCLACPFLDLEMIEEAKSIVDGVRERPRMTIHEALSRLAVVKEMAEVDAA